MIRRIVVCEALVPFVRGGAEYLVKTLVAQLRTHGYSVEQISLPFKWYPKDELLAHAAAWRLLDLSESIHQSIDLLIATKFPTYFARHPNKVAWLLHQHRAAYELCDSQYSDFFHTEPDVGLRETLIRLDREMIEECRRVRTISRNTAARLEKFNGLHHEPLYPPPPFADKIEPGPQGDYVLFVGRLETVKRADLVIDAMQHVDRPVTLVVVGEGTQRENLDALVESRQLGDRVTMAGAVDEPALVDYYRGALAVVFPPYDEDYGYVTLEAFLAGKPVVTAVDSGGPLEFVDHEVNGLVCEPMPEVIAQAINRLARQRKWAAGLGAAGRDRARTVTWDGVIEQLVEA